MKKGLVKLMAVVSTFAILLSQTVASANFILNSSEKVIDSHVTWQYSPWMIPGFRFDSATYSYEPKMGRNEFEPDNETVYNTYGNYHGHMKWQNNLTDKGWTAEDSQNIYPIGIGGETDYSAINGIQSYNEQKYTDYQIFDLEFWNGLMFVVMNRETWTADNYADELHSVIQIYDVANGKKDHVASWDFDDFDFGQTDETMEYAVRDIEVTDDNIFMLLDVKNGSWTHEKEWRTGGGALAIMDNNISRADYDYSMPTKSELQQELTDAGDRSWMGIDPQNGMRMRSETVDGSILKVMGDYLVYIPRAGGDSFGQLGDDNNTHGVWITKWNDPDRAANANIRFEGKSFGDWLGITFPEGWYGAEYSHRGTPAMANFEINGDYAYMDVVYTVADEASSTGFTQYDKVYVIDMTDPVNPAIVGESAGITNPYTSFEYPLYQLNRRMTVADGFVYIGQYNWNGFRMSDEPYQPYVYIVDVRDAKNPVLANALNIRADFGITQEWGWGGVDAIAVVGDYALISCSEYVTLIVQLNADKTEIVDSVWQQLAMSWGYVSGSPDPTVYDSRIFYPSVGNGGRDVPSTWTEDIVGPETGEVIEQIVHEYVDEDGNWIESSLDREYRYQSRIEVVDFGHSNPMGIFIDSAVKNDDDTFDLTGRIQGVEVLPSMFGIPAITVYDADTDEYVTDIYYDDLELEITAENDISGWYFTTDADMPTNLKFVVNDMWGDALVDAEGNVILYETIDLAMIGVDPVFTLTATYSAEAIAAGDFTVTANASNMTAKDIEDAVIIVAVYDAEGKLVAVTTGAPETITSGDAKDLTPVTVTVPAADSYDGYAVKTFMFNSVEGMAPVCANLTF